QYAGTTLTLPDGSSIHNDESASYGSIDLRTAMWKSVNAVYARLILDTGVDKAMAMAQRLGVDMPQYDASKYGASVALGTTEDNANAWFVGFTPTLSTAVWMGHLDCGVGPKCALHNINGVGQVFGGTIPASTWQKYMKRALDVVDPTDFSQPAPIQPTAT